MMLEIAAYLGTSLFFGLLVLFFYQSNKESTRPKRQPVTVSLRIDRTSLLDSQWRAVTHRRNRLKNVAETKPPERINQPKETLPPVSEEPIDSGFGEDLGAALTLEQNPTITEKDKRNRSSSSGRSRFAALQDAADQFKDIYNRNSQLWWKSTLPVRLCLKRQLSVP